MSEVRENRDLVLSPNGYVYLKDTSKGDVKVYAGPCVVNQTGQDIPITYDPETDSYTDCPDLKAAVCKRPLAVQRDYLVLFNPSKDGEQPEPGASGRKSAELDFGRKINIPGPAEFPLWPGQAAVRIPGHHLRSNQYLLVKIYDAGEARANWDQAVVETKVETKTADPKTTEDPKTAAAQISTVPPNLAVGKLYIVKGTEVSFYIPPTGVSVVQDETTGNYVRDALTLERLEYAILVDEGGDKEYPRGPAVVFPKPTQAFIYDKQGRHKFRAVELNALQGIHAKVIAKYTEDGVTHEVGEELFIKGDEQPIYYPREEHSLISYDGRSKHFATAIPAGEARYVMNRISGEIDTIHGPAMLLPDPRSEVIVRRVLSDTQCNLWYPHNDEVLEYNTILRAMMSKSPTTRAGAVSEGDFERGLKKGGRSAKFRNVEGAKMEMSYTSSYGSENAGFVADEFSRASTYTDPRTITLNTKLEGVPTVCIFTNYAVQVVDKQGGRRVVEGPSTVLLSYDEELEAMSLSTGKPKTTDEMLHTPYLRIKNNKVSDVINVETSDHVTVTLKLSYRVDFTGDSSRWFGVENYVKFMCDHVRSVLKGAVQKIAIADFYARSVDIVRDLILGAKPEEGDRPGMLFEENGMCVMDVEVLKARIQDEQIHKLLSDAQHQAVATNIEVQAARRDLAVTKEKELINQQSFEVQLATVIKRMDAEETVAVLKHENDISHIQGELEQNSERRKVLEAKEGDSDFRFNADLARRGRNEEQTQRFLDVEADRQKAVLEAETTAAKERFGAAQGGFSEALIALSRDSTAVKVAEASSIERFIGGRSFGVALETIFSGAPALIQRVTGLGEGGTNKAAFSDDGSNGRDRV